MKLQVKQFDRASSARQHKRYSSADVMKEEGEEQLHAGTATSSSVLHRQHRQCGAAHQNSDMANGGRLQKSSISSRAERLNRATSREISNIFSQTQTRLSHMPINARYRYGGNITAKTPTYTLPADGPNRSRPFSLFRESSMKLSRSNSKRKRAPGQAEVLWSSKQQPGKYKTSARP